MNVLHVGAEVFPLVKTGGLADVMAALPPALRARGLNARLLLPGLPPIVESLSRVKVVAEWGAAFGAGRVRLLRGAAIAAVPSAGLFWWQQQHGRLLALEAEAKAPPRRTVTLRWNPEDVVDIYASLFRPGQPYRPIEFPYAPQRWPMAHADHVLVDGQPIGTGGRSKTSARPSTVPSSASASPVAQLMPSPPSMEARRSSRNRCTFVSSVKPSGRSVIWRPMWRRRSRACAW